MKELQLTGKEHHVETQDVRRSHERQGLNKSRGNVRDRFYQNRTASRKRRTSQSTDHLVKDCPTRFCLACCGGGGGGGEWT